MNKKSFVFVGDLLSTNDNGSVPMFDSYILKKGSSDQIRWIKNNLDSYVKALSFDMNRYEYQALPNKNNEINYEPLAPEKWNYWVIEHDEVQANKNLHIVLGLSQLDLTLLLDFTFAGNTTTSKGEEIPSTLIQPLTLANFYINNPTIGISAKNVTSKDVAEINTLHEKLTNYKTKSEKYDAINKALTDFIKLNDISNYSPFKVLSYFSILELLLTSYQKGRLLDSSISHQLNKKLQLLNNQFETPLQAELYFKGADTNTLSTVINKLYKYRNNIAHGNRSDFEAELQILKGSKDNIHNFLRDLLKRVLIFSISNPQLMKDLKEC